MTVGMQATTASINQALTSYSINLRNDLANIANFQEFVVGLGAAGLQAIGYSAADAASVLQYASYMATIAEIFAGTFGQAPAGAAAAAFNFGNALAPLSAGS